MYLVHFTNKNWYWYSHCIILIFQLVPASLKMLFIGAGNISQLVECLPHLHKTLGSNPQHHKQEMQFIATGPPFIKFLVSIFRLFSNTIQLTGGFEKTFLFLSKSCPFQVQSTVIWSKTIRGNLQTLQGILCLSAEVKSKLHGHQHTQPHYQPLPWADWQSYQHAFAMSYIPQETDPGIRVSLCIVLVWSWENSLELKGK